MLLFRSTTRRFTKTWLSFTVKSTLFFFLNMSTLSNLFVVLTRLRGSKVKLDQGLDVEKLDFKIFEHPALLNEDFCNIGCKRKK